MHSVWYVWQIWDTLMHVHITSQGLDLTGIQLIVQWKAPASINTLWQRFGRAARGEGEFAFAILIAEKEHFDEEKERKLAAKAKRLESRKRKRGKQSKNAPNKQRAIHDTAAASGQPGELPTPSRVPAEYGTGDAVSSDNEDVDENPEGDTEIQEHEQGRGEADVEEEAVAEAAEVAAVAAEANERRREVYNQRIKVESTKSKQERILQPAVLDLINAASRGLGCRRQSITLVYSNDKRGVYTSIGAFTKFSRFYLSLRPHGMRQALPTRLCPLFT